MLNNLCDYKKTNEINASKSSTIKINLTTRNYDSRENIFDITFSNTPSTELNSNKTSVDFLIAHELAHTLREQDTDQFIYIYDNKIPDSFNSFRIDQVKETARQLSEINFDDFKSDCNYLNCQHLKKKRNFNKSQKYSQMDEKITRNESFFSDFKSLESSASNDKVTCNDQNLYKKLFTDSVEHEMDSSVNLLSINFPPLVNKTNSQSSIYRDGFVTNQRYQTFKDNKRNEAQLTSCYDEVFQAKPEDDNDEDNDIDVNDEESTIEKEKINEEDEELNFKSFSSSPSSSISIHSIKNIQHIILEMPNDENDLTETNLKISNSKEKFENILKQKEQERIIDTENKYEKEELLLKTLQDECRYGFKRSNETDKMVMRSDAAIQMIKDRSNAEKMKNDFKKNLDTEGDSDIEDNKQCGHYFNNKDSTDSSGLILSDVLSKLVSKTQKTNQEKSSSIQFNNYKTNVDDYLNFNLKSQSSLNDLENESSRTAYNKNPLIESNIDSHGSSMTNSSKQDDEEDYDSYFNDVSNYTSENKPFKSIKYNKSNGTQKSSTNEFNNLEKTINELSQKHVAENKKLSTNLLSFPSSNSTLSSNPVTSISSQNNSGFHHKYQDLTYDPKLTTEKINSNKSLTTNIDENQPNKSSLKKNIKKSSKQNDSNQNKNNLESKEGLEYSKHYVDNVDTLLEFITSSNSNSNGRSSSNNKNNKSGNKKKQPTSVKQSNNSNYKAKPEKVKNQNNEENSKNEISDQAFLKSDSNSTLIKDSDEASLNEIIEPEKPKMNKIDIYSNNNPSIEKQDIDSINLIEAVSTKSNEDFVTVIKGRKIKKETTNKGNEDNKLKPNPAQTNNCCNFPTTNSIIQKKLNKKNNVFSEQKNNDNMNIIYSKQSPTFSSVIENSKILTEKTSNNSLISNSNQKLKELDCYSFPPLVSVEKLTQPDEFLQNNCKIQQSDNHLTKSYLKIDTGFKEDESNETKKSKFEFSKSKSIQSNSVVFLDELITRNKQTKSDNNKNKETMLNDIKFGFSSDEELPKQNQQTSKEIQQEITDLCTNTNKISLSGISNEEITFMSFDTNLNLTKETENKQINSYQTTTNENKTSDITDIDEINLSRKKKQKYKYKKSKNKTLNFSSSKFGSTKSSSSTFSISNQAITSSSMSESSIDESFNECDISKGTQKLRLNRPSYLKIKKLKLKSNSKKGKEICSTNENQNINPLKNQPPIENQNSHEYQNLGYYQQPYFTHQNTSAMTPYFYFQQNQTAAYLTSFYPNYPTGLIGAPQALQSSLVTTQNTQQACAPNLNHYPTHNLSNHSHVQFLPNMPSLNSTSVNSSASIPTGYYPCIQMPQISSTVPYQLHSLPLNCLNKHPEQSNLNQNPYYQNPLQNHPVMNSAVTNSSIQQPVLESMQENLNSNKNHQCLTKVETNFTKTPTLLANSENVNKQLEAGSKSTINNSNQFQQNNSLSYASPSINLSNTYFSNKQLYPSYFISSMDPSIQINHDLNQFNMQYFGAQPIVPYSYSIPSSNNNLYIQSTNTISHPPVPQATPNDIQNARHDFNSAESNTRFNTNKYQKNIQKNYPNPLTTTNNQNSLRNNQNIKQNTTHELSNSNYQHSSNNNFNSVHQPLNHNFNHSSQIIYQNNHYQQYHYNPNFSVGQQMNYECQAISNGLFDARPENSYEDQLNHKSKLNKN